MNNVHQTVCSPCTFSSRGDYAFSQSNIRVVTGKLYTEDLSGWFPFSNYPFLMGHIPQRCQSTHASIFSYVTVQSLVFMKITWLMHKLLQHIYMEGFHIKQWSIQPVHRSCQVVSEDAKINLNSQGQQWQRNFEGPDASFTISHTN